jgi:hypothetical protein
MSREINFIAIYIVVAWKHALIKASRYVTRKIIYPKLFVDFLDDHSPNNSGVLYIYNYLF